MSKTNKAKSDFLKMPFGTACNRLRKSILFSLVQETNRDICFRCGKKIDTENELSIEHKERWLNVSVDLFWGLDNIAFSHLVCNKPHNVKNSPFGMSICSKCKKVLPLDEFRADPKSHSPNKVYAYCINCERKFRRAYMKRYKRKK